MVQIKLRLTIHKTLSRPGVHRSRRAEPDAGGLNSYLKVTIVILGNHQTDFLKLRGAHFRHKFVEQRQDVMIRSMF